MFHFDLQASNKVCITYRKAILNFGDFSIFLILFFLLFILGIPSLVMFIDNQTKLFLEFYWISQKNIR